MLCIDEIQKPIAKEIATFEHAFKRALLSSTPLLNRITHYLVKRKGKQMRPMFVFFSAGICGGIKEATYRGATLVELLHTATLVHDDVVDNSHRRRGFLSVNTLWKNKVAVLVGDYLLSKGLLLALDNNDFSLLKIVSEAVKKMSEGELLQAEQLRLSHAEEALYYEIIRQKTASLIASCCACGAASAGADAVNIEKMRLLGEKMGIAFQIKDDLFAFETNNVGKPTDIDIKEKKITLPLIYALNQSSYMEKWRIINLVNRHRKKSEHISAITRFVQISGGLDYAKSQMKKYRTEALQILETFPVCVFRNGLEQLIYFTTERNM